MNPIDWREHFAKHLPTGKEWSLKQAFSEGYISWPDYATWARQNLKLPILNDSFMHASPPDASFWKKIQNEAQWTEEIVPLIQWEDIIYVGCLTTPQFGLPQHYVPVLASPLLLAEFWKVYHPTSSLESQKMDLLAEQPSASEVDFDSPEGIKIPIAKPGFDDSEEGAEIIEGLDLSMLKVQSSVPDDPNESLLSQFKDSKQEDELLLDDSFSNGESKNKSNLDESDMLSLADDSMPSPTAATNPIATPIAAPALEAKSTAPEKPQASESIGEFTATKAAPKKSEPISEVKASIYPLQRLLKAIPDAGLKVLTTVRENISSHYKRSWLLALDQGQAQARVYDPQTGVDNNENFAVQLSIPSCFTVAVTTLKPYHGYLVQSSASEKFFEDWNDSEIPDTITIVPISFDGECLGLMVAVGEKSAYSPTALAEVEEAAQGLFLELQPRKVAS